MQKKIHPTYYHDAVVTCICGNSFITGSVLKKIEVEICSDCHPFFTGDKKLVDTEGRVDRFLRKRAEAEKKRKPSKSSEKKTHSS